AGFDSINMDVIAGLPGETPEDMRRTLDAIVALGPDNLTVHTLALKRSSRLVEKLDEYPLPEAEAAEEMVSLGAEAAKALQMKPYYMYRQKYMRGNLENVGYAKAGKECIYNIDMMEDTTSIMAHGAGAMTKCIYDAERRVERVPNPKNIETYIEKIDRLAEEKLRLYSIG
ncbi:MAG: coproporphyrinogen dehydrogenase HemZ, partial [Clostridia bacterium]|nr:coproporphyrinogen dehydrogenase HemZ [Clostridia bacterium]